MATWTVDIQDSHPGIKLYSKVRKDGLINTIRALVLPRVVDCLMILSVSNFGMTRIGSGLEGSGFGII